jgi:hypothetical protein
VLEFIRNSANRCWIGPFLEMTGKQKNRGNTKWSKADEMRLATLISAGLPLRTIGTEMQRSYHSIEKRAWKIKREAAHSGLTTNQERLDVGHRSPRDYPTMDLSCDLTSEMARPLLNILYDRLTLHRAATIAATNEYRKIKPRFERVIAAIVRELLIAPSEDGVFAWVQVSTRRIRSSDLGINTDVFRNLIDGLAENGFVERLSGYINAEFSQAARRGRMTRLRATTKLITLCKQHNVTAENAMCCFSRRIDT